MRPDRWRELSRLYHEALQRPHAARARYLDNECGGDGALRRDLESLLAMPSETAAKYLVTGGALPHAFGAPHEMAHGASAIQTPVLAAGTRLGPYLVDAPLGAGGMGEVYRATDTRLQRTVAIKVLPRDRIANSEVRRRFLQEARAASALTHPHIVRLFDIARDGDIDFLVMEYLAGKPLDAIIADGPLPFDKTVEWAGQIADALVAAHGAGVIHRDIKPGNVLVTDDGQAKVLDFGLAKLAEPEPGVSAAAGNMVVTQAGMILGTFSHMSPEQARGEKLDARTDLFSFGVLLFEMATGLRAFPRTFDWTAAPLRGLDPKLARVIAKLIEPDRTLRYQAARDVLADLKRLGDAGL